MEPYVFHEGEIPPGYVLEFEESLFNIQEHRWLQTSKNWRSFYILNTKSKAISGDIHFQVENGHARSHPRSAFGSIELSHTTPEPVLFAFVNFFEKTLQQSGVTKITITHYPQVYGEKQTALLYVLLLNLRFQVVRAELSSVIPVSDEPLEKKLHRSEKRKLVKMKAQEFEFREVDISGLNNVYNFIFKCRAEKNYALSMTLPELKRTVALFPDRYLLFGVFKDHRMAAAAIAIRVRKNILYDFYHDHDAAFNSQSPVVMLVSGMYDFCSRSSIQLLDLGTSAVNGLPNFGLLHFKQFLGGVPTPKYTFEKELPA